MVEKREIEVVVEPSALHGDNTFPIVRQPADACASLLLLPTACRRLCPAAHGSQRVGGGYSAEPGSGPRWGAR